MEVAAKGKKDTQSSSPGGSAYDFFRSTAHELVSQDAAFQLIKPGESIKEILSKTTFPDNDYLNRVVQCIAKLEESELGESAEPPYDSGMNLIKHICIGLNSIHGRARGEFMQGLGRLFAPSYFELMETGKMSTKEEVKRKEGFFKKKDQKDEGEA